MLAIRAFALAFTLGSFASTASAAPKLIDTWVTRLKERSARMTYLQLHELINQQNYYRDARAALGQPSAQIEGLSDTYQRLAGFRIATDALARQAQAIDDWAILEDPTQRESRVAPPGGNVTAHRLPGNVGVIKIRRFRGTAVKEFDRSIDALIKRGPLEGLVLDLRGNNGGLVPDAVQILSKLVPSGHVVFTEAYGPADAPYKTNVVKSKRARSRLVQVPLAILTDGETASSAELVVGALKDLGRARVFGEPTYGKGIGQITRTLPDGRTFQQSEIAFKLPTTGSFHGVPLAPHESLDDTELRLEGWVSPRARGDLLLRGALAYLWEVQAALEKTTSR